MLFGHKPFAAIVPSFFNFAEHELEENSNLHFWQIANSDKSVRIFSFLSISQ